MCEFFNWREQSGHNARLAQARRDKARQQHEKEKQHGV